jgi:C4-type Zn-finger protein
MDDHIEKVINDIRQAHRGVCPICRSTRIGLEEMSLVESVIHSTWKCSECGYLGSGDDFMASLVGR